MVYTKLVYMAGAGRSPAIVWKPPVSAAYGEEPRLASRAFWREGDGQDTGELIAR